MDLKSQINGLDQTSMLVIGLIIKNMDLEYNTILMEISMKEDGKQIRDTGKVLIG
jgi:hypothetical protein